MNLRYIEVNSKINYIIVARGNGKTILSMAYFISQVYGISLEEAYSFAYDIIYCDIEDDFYETVERCRRKGV